MSIRRPGSPMCWRASTITKSTIWPRCYPGIGESRRQAALKRREPRGAREIDRLLRSRKIGGDFRLPAPDRRLPEAPFPAHHPADQVQLSRRYPGKVARTKYRFIQRYRSGFPENLGEEFDAPFARLDWISRNRFDIQ